MNWLSDNKEWLFSGAGLSAIAALIYIFRKFSNFRRAPKTDRSVQSALMTTTGQINSFSNVKHKPKVIDRRVQFVDALIVKKNSESLTLNLKILNTSNEMIVFKRLNVFVDDFYIEVPTSIQICAIWSTATYDVDISDLKKGNAATVPIAQKVAPNDSDAILLNIGARHIKQTVKYAWNLRLWFETSSGDSDYREFTVHFSRGEELGSGWVKLAEPERIEQFLSRNE